MPTLTGDAPILRAALATLQTQLPDRIAVFNGESANTVDLEPVQTFHFGPTDQLASFPFSQVEVMAAQGSTGEFSVDRVEFDSDLAVDVVLWQERTDGEVQAGYEAALGYKRCLLETLIPTGAFGQEAELAQSNGVVWRIDMLPFEPTAEGRQIRKWRIPVLCRFRLETVDRFV